MSQNDFSLDNQNGADFRADVNSALQALASCSSGATEPSTTYAYMLWADTTANVLKQRNGADSAWIILRSLDSAFLEAKSATFTVGDDDTHKIMWCTGAGYTINFDPVATLGNNFVCWIKNDSANDMTLDGNSTETINGSTTLTLKPGQTVMVATDGTNLKAVIHYKPVGKQTIWIKGTGLEAISGSPNIVAKQLDAGGAYFFMTGMAFDSSTDEYAQIEVGFPKQWDKGTVTVKLVWGAESGSGGVTWQVAAGAFADDDTLTTQAGGTEVEIEDTLLAADDVHVTAESAAITISGSPGDDELVIFRIRRDTADANDTLAVDAILIGMWIYFTNDNTNDD